MGGKTNIVSAFITMFYIYGLVLKLELGNTSENNHGFLELKINFSIFCISSPMIDAKEYS